MSYQDVILATLVELPWGGFYSQYFSWVPYCTDYMIEEGYVICGM